MQVNKYESGQNRPDRRERRRIYGILKRKLKKANSEEERLKVELEFTLNGFKRKQ